MMIEPANQKKTPPPHTQVEFLVGLLTGQGLEGFCSIISAAGHLNGKGQPQPGMQDAGWKHSIHL